MTRTWCGNGQGRLDCRRLFGRQGVLSSLSQALIAPFSGGSMLELPGLRLPPAGFLLLLPFLLLLLPATPAPHRASYKPVIVVHGLFDSSYSFRHLLEYINEVWQGTSGCGALVVASTEAGEGEWGIECWACQLPRGAGAGVGKVWGREIVSSSRAQ